MQKGLDDTWKVAGKATRNVSTIRLKGVFKTLAEEHGQAVALLRRASTTGDANARARLWQELRLQLLAHENAEAAAVYSAIQETGKVTMVRLHTQDTAEMTELITAVDGVDMGSREWTEAMGALIANVEAHAVVEERDFFPQGQQALGDEATERLDAVYRRAKQIIMHGA